MTKVTLRTGQEYWAGKLADGSFYVSARPGLQTFEEKCEDPEMARRWLSDRGLKKSKARRLIAAAVALLFSVPAFGSDIVLKWNPNSDQVSGYRLYYGTAPGVINGSIDVGNATTVTVPNLTVGRTYYFAVSAFGPAPTKFESKLSAELAAVAGAVTATFNISVAPAINPETSVKNVNSYVVTVTRNGYTVPINFNVNGLPDGTLAPKFSTNPAQTKSTLTLTTTACTLPATYTFTVVGFGCTPPLTRTATATLQIK